MAHKSSPLAHESETGTWKHALLLSFQSLGVVYGHLSISPLYTFETIGAKVIKSEEGLFGFLSFMFWTMTLIPLVKYVLIVLRADDNGEGGTFALYSLLCRHARVGLLPNNKVADDELLTHETGSLSETKKESRARSVIETHKSSHYLLLFMALLGCCMVIVDGILTPAISVFSASSCLGQSLSNIIVHEHFVSYKLETASSKSIKRYVPIPVACAILVGLFMLQRYGTNKLGFLFAPIIMVWLIFISGIGLYNIFHWNPRVIHAISPQHVYKLIKNVDCESWTSLGGVLLCIAGSEAIFADLGHLSRKSIKVAFGLVYPSLILSYMGQTAFISKHLTPGIDFTTFSASIPEKLHHTVTVLSLLASAVGSQATITATFSIINQCLALGCFPRVKVVHTSDKIHGQVYIPDVNWILMALCLAITISFGDVQRIGNATGFAIITSMLITTCLMSLTISLCWEKNILISAFFLFFFGSIEAIFFSACMLNFHRGAWFLVILLALLMITMLAWHYGTMKKYKFDMQNKVSMEWLTSLGPSLGVARVPGIGFIYTDIMVGVPAFFSHFVTNLPAFHQVLIFVSFKSLPMPYVPPSRQYLIGRLGPKEHRVYRCIVRYGYCDNVRNTDNFENKLIQRIGEFVSVEGNDTEAVSSPEGRMVVIANLMQGASVLIPRSDPDSFAGHSNLVNAQSPKISPSELPQSSHCSVRKKVRFLLSPESPKMTSSIREELQELVDARESGTAYFLGQSNLTPRQGSNFLKKILIKIYVILDKNCRDPSVELNIPHAALVEVGMIYTI